MTIVYILTNEIMPEVIKIGITKNLEERIKSLDNTSTPLPFECYYAVETNNAKEVEKLLHETFEDKRIRKNREFFRCLPEQAKSALLIVEKLGGTDVTPTKYIVENKEDIKALKIAKGKPINYFEILGINKGDELTFKNDDSYKCVVIDDKNVSYKDEVLTLSQSASMILKELGYSWKAVRGASYWCLEGETLLSLYNQHEQA